MSHYGTNEGAGSLHRGSRADCTHPDCVAFTEATRPNKPAELDPDDIHFPHLGGTLIAGVDF